MGRYRPHALTPHLALFPRANRLRLSMTKRFAMSPYGIEAVLRCKSSRQIKLLAPPHFRSAGRLLDQFNCMGWWGLSNEKAGIATSNFSPLAVVIS